MGKKQKTKKIIGLDALRFFAITFIVIYHCFPGVLSGGFLAVEIFFAVSGFLIGQKLLRAKRREGEEFGGWRSFWRFLWDRLKRFCPTLVFCMILTLSLAYFADPDLLTAARPNSLYAITFSTNIMSIINGSTYENSLIPNLFNQTWFLALELQVCIICFLVMAGFFRFLPIKKDNTKKRYKELMFFSVVISLISFGLMAIYGGWFRLFDRAYFGPDSHVGAFFAGVALAAFTFMRKVWPAKHGKKWLWAVALTISLGLIGAMTPFIAYESPEAFTLALPATGILSIVIIVAILKLQNLTRRVTLRSLRILEYLGSLAFVIYLLHYGLDIILPSLLNFWPAEVIPYVVIMTSIVLAILLQKVIIPFSQKHKIWFLILLLASLVLPILSLVKAPEKSSIEESLIEATEIVAEEKSEEKIEEKPVAVDYSGATELANLLSNDVMKFFDATENFAKPYPVTMRGGGGGYYNSSGRAYYNTPDYSRTSALAAARVMVLGDSVVLGATNAIYNTVPGAFVDAMQSRNMFDAINLLAGYRAANGGNLPRVIVIGLVTNYSGFNSGTLQTIIDTAGPGHQFVFMTGYCGDYSREYQNSVIKAVASAYGNVRVGDWAATVIPNVSWYTYADHTHLTPAGRQAYANLINGIVSGL